MQNITLKHWLIAAIASPFIGLAIGLAIGLITAS